MSTNLKLGTIDLKTPKHVHYSYIINKHVVTIGTCMLTTVRIFRYRKYELTTIRMNRYHQYLAAKNSQNISLIKEIPVYNYKNIS